MRACAVRLDASSTKRGELRLERHAATLPRGIARVRLAVAAIRRASVGPVAARRVQRAHVRRRMDGAAPLRRRLVALRAPVGVVAAAAFRVVAARDCVVLALASVAARRRRAEVAAHVAAVGGARRGVRLRTLAEERWTVGGRGHGEQRRDGQQGAHSSSFFDVGCRLIFEADNKRAGNNSRSPQRFRFPNATRWSCPTESPDVSSTSNRLAGQRDACSFLVRTPHSTNGICRKHRRCYRIHDKSGDWFRADRAHCRSILGTCIESCRDGTTPSRRTADRRGDTDCERIARCRRSQHSRKSPGDAGTQRSQCTADKKFFDGDESIRLGQTDRRKLLCGKPPQPRHRPI